MIDGTGRGYSSFLGDTVIVPVESATATIGSTGPSAAPTAATAGNYVLVGPGTFTENSSVTKTVNLYGAQQGVNTRGRAATETIIASAANTPTITVAFNGTLAIDGFSFSGGPTGSFGVIFTSVGPNNNMQIVNNRFSDFSARPSG